MIFTSAFVSQWLLLASVFSQLKLSILSGPQPINTNSSQALKVEKRSV